MHARAHSHSSTHLGIRKLLGRQCLQLPEPPRLVEHPLPSLSSRNTRIDFSFAPSFVSFPVSFPPTPLSCPKRSRRATGGQAGPDGQCAQKRVAAQAVEQRVSAVAAAAGRLAGHCQRCVRIEFARACRVGRTVCADSIGSFAAGKTLTLKANEDASRCRQVRIPHTQLRTRQRQRNMPILIAPSHPPLHHV